MAVVEKIGWATRLEICRFKDPTGEIAEALRRGADVEVFKDALISRDVEEGNGALNEGLQQLIDILIGVDTTNLYNAANARVGVGNSSTAEVATQTGLL